MKTKSALNICIVFNDSQGDYIVKCFPTIFSILENNQTEQLDFYIIYKGSDYIYIDYLKKIFKKYKQNLHLINDFGDKEYLVDFFRDNNTSSWNYGTFFKLLIPLLLPEEVDSVINFDSDDVIVDGSLVEMGKIQLGDKLIASVKMPEGSERKNKKQELKVDNPFRMGGNIYNLKELRKIDFEKIMKETIKKERKKMKNAELDIINIICDKRVLYIDDTFNFCPSDYKTFKQGKLVYHFAGKKFYLFKYIFGINKNYRKIFEKYSSLPEYKFKKRFDLIRSLYSISFFKFFIQRFITFLDFLGIKKTVKKLLSYT